MSILPPGKYGDSEVSTDPTAVSSHVCFFISPYCVMMPCHVHGMARGGEIIISLFSGG